MIKEIAKIRGLGVYDNYTKPPGTKEFATKNLIYGWNYSGKTTLSRLFAQIENRKPNPDLAGCSFSIETDSDVITEANFTESALTVRVFNSDFVRDNLNFTGQSFHPILLLGKESEEAQKKLDHCEKLLKRADEKARHFAKQAEDLKSAFASSKTATAARIKKTLGLVEAYTAVHLANDIQTVSSLGRSQILADDKLRGLLKLALTPDSERPATVDRLALMPSLDSEYKEVESVLALTPSLSSTIKHFEENPPIERWVEDGLELHLGKDSCEFCGGAIGNDRLTQLQAHFSKDLADHKAKVERLYQRVLAAKVKIALPTEAVFNPQYREEFRKASIALTSAVESFNKSAEALSSDIKRKLDAPFKALVPNPLPRGLTKAVVDAVEPINVIIEENNRIASDFTSAKSEAIKLTKYHYVQEFVDEEATSGRDVRIRRAKAKQGRLNRFAEVVRTEADRLRAIISRAQLGREEMNKRLASMLGGEAVQIEVVPDAGQERFQLVRKNRKPARNLSDGEKTAIAFCYFLTKLKELKPEQFKETIVYIDDPISSLDANHIFQVTAAIRELFFSQEEEGGPWSTTCKQLFVSTHNFEFFHLLRELKPDNQSQARHYLIRRVGMDKSTIGDLPASLLKYASEYHFLFETILKFHKAPDKTDHEILLLLPNAVRRFVELYTYSRLPGAYKDTVDQRAEALFGKEKAKRILKVFHYFSHANTIDRLAGNSELIFDVENAVADLFTAIQHSDPLHWDALVQATGPAVMPSKTEPLAPV